MMRNVLFVCVIDDASKLFKEEFEDFDSDVVLG
jgi:hypothetical protein